ncbi:hypothetical protein OQA88_5725 [Cercophora sp. LCS_1]
MANFKDWALQYVLSDDEPAQLDIVNKVAREIESSNAARAVVGNWAASVQPWMNRAQAGEDDQMEDGDDGGGGDIISRAKALGFLAGTLESLDKSLLRTDQVVFLVGFFGAIFSYDHKSGITASTKALRQLHAMKGFKPDMGVKLVEDVLNLKEDFRKQTAQTRLEIYELFLVLLQDPPVASELQHKYGPSCGFVVDLLQLCQLERDPRNLMVWFKIIKLLLADYSPSTEVTEEIFKAFSAYFPISLRSSATPIGITAEDLKGAVRECFSAHQRVAGFAFPFLIQKLDQGDAVTVAVKVDILRTIKACIDGYENPQTSVVPHIEKIWNSLKYEVRNGEVKETIDATLDVLRAIANKLDGSAAQKLEPSSLKNYIDLVFKDCREDLGNPTYTKQAGLLVMTIITTNIRSYLLESETLVDCIRQNLRQPKSPSHTDDLLLILNSFLKERSRLVKDRKQGHPEDEDQLKSEPRENIENLFHDTYLRIWTAKLNDPESKSVLKQVIKGLALLASQQAVQEDGHAVLLCSQSTCSEVCTLLIQCLVKGLTLSSNDNASNDAGLEEEAQQALRTVAGSYTPAYSDFARRAKADIQKRDWTGASKYSLDALRDLLFRLAYVGCSEIPSNIQFDVDHSKSFSPLQHFITFSATIFELFPLSTPSAVGNECLENSYVIAALHAGLLFFRDACILKYSAESLKSYSKNDKNWLGEFNHLLDDWLQQMQLNDVKDSEVHNLAEDDPEVYRQFLRLSLIIVRQLYREAASGLPTIWSGRLVSQVANIAALVVQSLDEQAQTSCGLAREAFNFFAGDGLSTPDERPSNPYTELLTRGVLEGLHPGAMTELYQPGGLVEDFLCTLPEGESIDPRKNEIRATIGLILANKYKGGPSTSDPESQTLKRVLQFWGSKLKEAVNSTVVDAATFGSRTNVALHIIAGAAARQDKNVQELAPLLREAIASDSPNGAILARSMGTLVKDNDLLSPENHAVVRRFYKQWAYTHFAKPLYSLALPADGVTSASSRHRAAILSIVSNCVFTVYEADIEPLIRLLITTLGGRSNPTERAQLVAALEVLVEILANEPDALKSHLKAVIGGSMGVYDGCLEDAKGGAPARKLVLQALAAIPKKYEERHLLPYALQLQRMLWVACGDPVRDVRSVARLARGNWTGVGAKGE